MHSKKDSFIRNHSSRWAKSLAVGAIALSLISGAQAQKKYLVTDLGQLSGAVGTYPLHVNINQQVAGQSLTMSTSDAFIWDQGVLSDLGVVPGRHTALTKWVNDLFEAVGTSGSGSDSVAFFWSNGVMTSLEAVATQIFQVPTPSAAVQNNNNGWLFLNVIPQGGGAGWLDNLGQVGTIPPLNPNIIYIDGWCMNNLNRMAGTQQDIQGNWHVYWYDPARPVNIAAQEQELSVIRGGDTYAYPTAIVDSNPFLGTDRGLVFGNTGFYVTDPITGKQFFTPQAWASQSDTGASYFETLPFDSISEVNAANNSFIAAGRSGQLNKINGKYSYVWHPCLWIPQLPAPHWIQPGMIELQKMLPPGFDLTLENAYSINDNNQVTAVASKGGIYHALLLTPVTTPVALTLNPSVIPGGDTCKATVQVDDIVPAGFKVNVTSNSIYASVPATVTIPQGDFSAKFNITTQAVTTPQSAVITCEKYGYTTSATLHINPISMNNIQCIPTSITGGLPSVLRINVYGAGTLQVDLSSNNPSVANCASQVTVVTAGNIRFKDIPITTTVVTSPKVVTFTATAKGITKTANLSVVTPYLKSFTISPNTVMGGQTAQGTLTLTNRALPPVANVVMVSSSPSVATCAGIVKIPGGSVNTTFTIVTARIRFDSLVTFTATFNSSSVTAQLMVRGPALSSFTITPSTVKTSAGAQGVVRLDAPMVPPGADITIVSGNPASAQAPGSVHIGVNGTSAAFTITTSYVPYTQTVVFTASYLAVSKVASLTITSADLISNTANPTTLVGGNTSTGTVTLAYGSPMPTGTVVSLTSSDPLVATVPPSVTIPRFATSANYPITTLPQVNPQTVTITATNGPVTKTVTLTVTP